MIGGGMSHRGFMGRKKAGAWQPSDIPNMILWLDAIDSSTIIDTVDGVTQWDDKSLLGNDLTQPTAALRPSYNSTYIDFDGVNDSLVKDSAVSGFGLTEGTFFAVFNSDTSGTTVIHSIALNEVVALQYIPIFYITSGYLTFGIRTSVGGLITVPTSISTGVTYIATGVWDGNNIELFVNQVSVGTNSGANMDLSTGTNRITIGRRTHSLQNYYNGKIMSILDYSRALNTTEIAQVETYLIDRYGL